MNNLALLLAAAIVVTGCSPAAAPQPTAIPPSPIVQPSPIPPTVTPTAKPKPTATPTPVEIPIAANTDLVGTWWFATWPLQVEFRADGSYRIFTVMSGWSGTEAEGKFKAEAGKLTLLTSKPLCASLPAPSYNAYLTMQDGAPAWLRLEALAEDGCQMRSIAFKGRGKFLQP